MANYDQNVASGSLEVDLKRRTWRVDIQRPADGEGAAGLIANCFLKEDLFNAQSGSLYSGSVMASSNWLLTYDKNTILGLGGATNFFNNLLQLIGDSKDYYNVSGSVLTGSIQSIP